MDDLSAFDRQLASAMVHRAGPVRPVDDAAIFTAVTATESPTWRFQSMFSATKFIVAGAIVALFGGLLLSGVLTQQPSEEPPAVGASASATTQAEPTDAATSEPEPTAEIEADDTTTSPDTLSGMVTEEPEPGVFRILNDGVRDLSEPRAMAIGQDGHVWLTWEGQRHGADRQDPGVLRRLGEPGEQAHEAANWDSDMTVDTAGTFWGTHDPGLGEDLSVTSFDGSTWTIHDWPAAFEPEGFSVEAASDGSVLVTSQDGVARIRDGEWTLLPSWEAATRGLVFSSRVATTDASVWLGCGGHIRTGEAGCEGLLRFDGAAWDLMTPVPGRSDLYAKHLAAGPDGTLWAYLHAADDEEDRYLARLRDDRWSVFSAEDGVPLLESTYEWGTDLAVDGSGTLWMATSMDWDDPRASATGLLELPHGIASFDGSTWRQYLADVNVQQVEAIGGHVWALDSEDYQGRGVYGSGLYVITPEAVATADAIAVEPADDATTTPDLLPGVDLVTEEVEPGVYRVLSDGAGHDLVAQPPGDVTVAPDGSVWLLRRASEDGFRDPVGIKVDAVFRLGREGTSLFGPAGPSNEWWTDFAVDTDGLAWVTIGADLESATLGSGLDGATLGALDGSAWLAPTWPDGSAGVAAIESTADGAVWVTQSLEDGPGPRVARIADGEWTELPPLQGPMSVGDFYAWPKYLAAAADGTAWLANGNHHLGSRDKADPPTRGLLHFDGTGWEVVDLPVDDTSGGSARPPADGRQPWRAGPLALGSDATLWVYLERQTQGRLTCSKSGYLARLRDGEWSLFGRSDGVPTLVCGQGPEAGMAVDGDGRLWVADPVKNGVRSFDGTSWQRYLTELKINRVRAMPDGSVIATALYGCPTSCGDINEDIDWSKGGLYVITPEAVPAAE